MESYQSGIVVLLRILALTIVLVLHSACGLSAETDDQIEIVYDPCTGINIEPAPDTTPAELAAIDSSIDLWSRVANLKLTRDPTTRFDQTLEVQFENAALIFRGVYQDQVGNIVINRRLDDPSQRAITVAHELGHALGLPHINTRDSVMNNGNLVLLPLAEDVDALSELWGPCVRDGGTPIASDELQQLVELKIPNQP